MSDRAPFPVHQPGGVESLRQGRGHPPEPPQPGPHDLGGAYRELAEKYQRLRGTIPGLIYAYALRPDGSHAFPYVSPAVRALFGLEPEAVMRDGTLLSGLIHPDDRARRDESIRRSAETMQPWRQELRHVVDGQVRWYDCMSCPERQPDGTILWDGIMLEITDRKQAEAALERTRLLLEALLDQSPAPTVVASAPDLVVRYANRAAVEFLGLSDEPSYVGLPLPEVQRRQSWRDVRPDGRPIDLLAMPLARALRGEVTRNEEYGAIRKDGTTRWELVSGMPIRDSSGELIAGLIVFPDITERKQAEAERARLIAILEGTSDLVATATPDGRLTYMNAAGRRLLGFDPDEDIARYLIADAHPAWAGARVRDEAIPAALTSRVWQGETVLSHRDGHEIPVSQVIIAHRDSRGEVQFLSTIMRDVSGSKQAEERLRQSELRYRELFECISSGVAVYRAVDDGRDFVFVDFNRAGERIEKTTRSDLIGKRVTEAFPGVEAFGLLDVFRQVWRTGTPAHHPISQYQDDRVESWRENFVYRLPSGEIVAVYDDVTPQKRAEEERDRLFNLSLDLLCVAGFDGYFKQLNPAWERTLGWPVEDLLRKPSLEFVHPDDRARTVQAGARLAAGEAQQSFENRYLCRDGSHRWLSWNSFPLVNEKRIFAVVRDISERKRAEEENQRLQSELLRAQRMEAIGQLAGGVAHDFNNILTAIFGHAELAIADLQARLPAAQNSLDGMQQIRRSAERASALTRQLLAFSRRQVTRPEVLSLNATLRSLEKMLRRLISENIDLELALAPNLPAAEVDPGQLEQVIVNLVVNARDAMPEGGKLVLETSFVVLDESYVASHAEARAGEHVQLSVSDTGCGMDPATITHIFEPFFTTKQPGKGTGLGLSTVYGIVKQAGGHITTYSEPERGTIFRLYLPSVRKPLAASPAAPAEPAPPVGTETILLCEDDPAVRELATHLLTDVGYHVLVAEGPRRALQLAELSAGSIQLLLTDVIMPEMNGRTLSDVLKAKRPELRSLYMSGYTSDVIAHHGVLDQGVEFLEKPFSRRSLLKRVREVLDKPAAASRM